MAIAKPPAGCRRYNAFPILPIRPLRGVLRGSFVTLVTPGFYLRAVTIVVGRERLLRKLQELAAASRNEVFATHLPTKEVIATLNPLQPQ